MEEIQRTCQDVIRSLVHSQDSSKVAIVEKWRKMERKLDPSVRILKVWKKDDVALILKQHHTPDGYIDKKISNKVLRRKSSLNHKLSNQVESDDEVPAPMKESMEHLLKLVLTQGETIQAQLKKLRHQEEQIERYEERMHRVRSLQDGENYVVESYLRDEKVRKSNRKRDKSPRNQESAGRRHQARNSETKVHKVQQCNLGAASSSESPPGICPDIRIESEDTESTTILQQNEMLERICEVNSQLTREEERLLKLGFKLRKLYERRTSTADTCVDASSATISPEECVDFHILTELEALRSVTSEQARDIERNEESLNQLEQFLDVKQDHMIHLSFLMEQLDQESEVLKQKLQEITFQRDFNILKKPIENLCPQLQLQPKNTNMTSSSPSSEESLQCQCLHPCTNHPRDSKKSCRDQQDNDSNSDTGISSLHSSGDENTLCILDTLV